MPKDTTINVKCTDAFKDAIKRDLPIVTQATDGEIDNLSALARAGMRLMVKQAKAALSAQHEEGNMGGP